jgi:hypothetical protein
MFDRIRRMTRLFLVGIFTALAIVRAADDSSPAAMMARIENVQSPNRQGLDGYSCGR